MKRASSSRLGLIRRVGKGALLRAMPTRTRARFRSRGHGARDQLSTQKQNWSARLCPPGGSCTAPRNDGVIDERNKVGPRRKRIGRLKIPHETEARKQNEHRPARIRFARAQPKARRGRECMMIVVPGLAHGDEPAIANIVSLHARALDVPGARAAIVREIADEPMSRYRNRHAHGDPPNKPGQTTENEKQASPRELLHHPSALNELIKPILRDASFHDQAGRMSEDELAVQLPESVAHDPRAMGEVRVTLRLALRPVADVVLADHAVGSRHADQRAEIDKQPLEPERTIEGAVNE